MQRPTLDDLREENDPGCLERERLQREAPAMAKRITELEGAIRYGIDLLKAGLVEEAIFEMDRRLTETEF